MSREPLTMRSRTSSWMSRCSSTRVPAVHTWPEAPHTPIVAAATAASRSASGKTMNGALAAELQADALDALGGRGLDRAAGGHRAGERDRVDLAVRRRAPRRPTSPMPCTTLNTPGGMPGLERPARPSATAAIGVCSAGLSTTQLPVASAPATKPSTNGRPVPRRDEADDADRLADCVDRELRRHRRGSCPRASRASPRSTRCRRRPNCDDEARVHPQQPGVEHVELAEQRRRARPSSSASRRSRRSFSSGGRCRQRPSSNAARAERTARSTSAAAPAAAVAICSPVAGSITGIVAPSSDGTVSPSITWPKTSRSSTPRGRRGDGRVVAASVMALLRDLSDLNSIRIT